MQGYSETIAPGGFQKVIFESVIDTYAGGVCLDPTGLSEKFPDGIVPAGTLVGKPDAVTGLSKVITITPGTPATFDKVPLGFTQSSIKIDDNPLVGVVTEGVVRKAALPLAAASTYADDIKDKLPKIDFV